MAVLLADAEDSGNSDVVHSEDPDGEDAVAAEANRDTNAATSSRKLEHSTTATSDEDGDD